MVTLTDLEQKVMETACGYCQGFEGIRDGGHPWSFAVLDEAGISTKVGRGVLSSLVQKGLISICDCEGRGRFDDMSISFTDAGKAMFNIE